MSIREEITPYLDADGLVSPSLTSPGQRNASGNGLLYLCEYYLTLKKREEVTFDDSFNFIHVTNICEVVPGLYNRAPTHKDQEGPDDYVALAATSLKIAQNILHYGQNNSVKLWGPFKLKYVYNNVLPGTLKHPDGRWNWSAWLGRQPQLIAHFMWAAGCTPSWWRQLWWAIVISTSGLFNPKSQDSWTLSWFMLHTSKNKNWMTKLVYKIWLSRLYKHWPGGINEVLRSYFGFDHPLAKYFITE